MEICDTQFIHVEDAVIFVMKRNYVKCIHQIITIEKDE